MKIQNSIRMGNFINGRWIIPPQPDGVLRIESPADTSDIVSTHTYSVHAAEEAIYSARNASRLWRKTSWVKRCEILRAYRTELDKHKNGLIELLVREIGKPIWDATNEIRAMMGKIEISIEAGSTWGLPQSVASAPGEVHFKPLGVVAVIGPFNFPGHLPNGQFIPALLHGNTVVFKPSEKAPSFANLMTQCLEDAGVPPGVFNTVHGGAAVAEAIVSHDDIDGILFTGSVAVGQKITRANTHRVDRMIALELGGKNASVVLDDADIDVAAREIAFAGFASSGQRCSSTSRVVVAKPIADELITRLALMAKQIRVGYPGDHEVFMGPLISEDARQRFIAGLEEGRLTGFHSVTSFGAYELAGKTGFYVYPSVHVASSSPPTVKIKRLDRHSLPPISQIESSRIEPLQKAELVDHYADTELFGPDIAVYIAATESAALTLANQSRFGLSASVFTSSREHFDAIADDLEVGVVHWNRSTAGASSQLPFGGIKMSGNHRPGARLMGQSCGYPQARLLLPDNPSSLVTSWPGFPSTHGER